MGTTARISQVFKRATVIAMQVLVGTTTTSIMQVLVGACRRIDNLTVILAIISMNNITGVITCMTSPSGGAMAIDNSTDTATDGLSSRAITIAMLLLLPTWATTVTKALGRRVTTTCSVWAITVHRLRAVVRTQSAGTTPCTTTAAMLRTQHWTSPIWRTTSACTKSLG